MNSFSVKIVTTFEKKSLKSIKTAYIPTFDGQIGVLGEHCDYVSELGNGYALFQTSENEKVPFFFSGGTVYFKDNCLICLCDRAWSEETDFFEEITRDAQSIIKAGIDSEDETKFYLAQSYIDFK